MRRAFSIHLLCLAFVLAHCATPRFDSVPMKRLPPSGDELLELDSRNPGSRLASRLVEIPGRADLTVFAEPTNPSAPLRLEVLHTDGTPVARGVAPLELRNLKPQRYIVVVRLDRGATRVRLATVLALHDADARSGPDALPETATPLESDVPLRGRVDWFALDSTDHFSISTRAHDRLQLSVALERRRGTIASTLLSPSGAATELAPGAEHVVESTEEGTYVLRIRTADGAAADYIVRAVVTPWDPDGSRERATVLTPDEVMELRGELNPVGGDREDWYRFELDRPAELKITRALPPSVRLDWLADDAEEPVSVEAGKSLRLQDGSHYLRVSSRESTGELSYRTQLSLTRELEMEAALLERFRRDGCVLVIDRGADHRLRRGIDADVFRGRERVAEGTVDAVYRSTSRVRVPDADCAFGSDTTVRLRFVP